MMSSCLHVVLMTIVTDDQPARRSNDKGFMMSSCLHGVLMTIHVVTDDQPARSPLVCMSCLPSEIENTIQVLIISIVRLWNTCIALLAFNQSFTFENRTRAKICSSRYCMESDSVWVYTLQLDLESTTPYLAVDLEFSVKPSQGCPKDMLGLVYHNIHEPLLPARVVVVPLNLNDEI